jgi:predicted lipoprotein with Yx(FWY)xxD motif
MHSSQRLGAARVQLGLRVVGAGLLVADAAIHLDLYTNGGFRNIPTIGWLFLLQVIAGFGLAILVLFPGGRLMAALGAGFAVATLGGYLLSIWFGLFGFHEVRTTAGIVAGLIEIAAFAVLAPVALTPAEPAKAGVPAHAGVSARGGASGGGGAANGPGRVAPAADGTLMARLQAGIPHAGAVVAGLSALALVLLIIAVAGAGSGATTAGGSGQELKTTTIHGVTVLTNAKGFTLYSFAPDTATKSVCNGSCAQYWPPVPGHVRAGPGVTGTIGTITRSDGSSQATYNGHPLYTYVSDTSPGQDSGNNLNINGGLWHDVTASG